MLSSGDVSSLGIENTINSVLAFALALSELINDTCPDGRICNAVFDVMSRDWLKQLKEVAFTSPVGLRKRVSFDEKGDGPALYPVYKFTEMSGVYSYREVNCM